MNIFDRLIGREVDQASRLGNPLGVKTGPFLARMNAMSLMTGGRGFRTPKKGVKLSKAGTTRKQREAHLRPLYLKNLQAETDFRAAHTGHPGWSIAKINRAIERGLHLRSRTQDR